MKTKQIIAVLLLIGINSIETKIQAQKMKMSPDHIMVMPKDMKWEDGPPSLPPGAKVAVLEGDPKATGSLTMRFKVPANYIIMPHTHPADEHVTVLEGSLYMGMGEKFNKKTATKIPMGGFAMMKKGAKHYAFSNEPCIIQLNGMGPWGINYLNPSDDPRNSKKKNK